MKKLFIYTILASLIITPAYADEVTKINKGQPAPYDGIIMDNEKANKIKSDIVEKEALENINKSLNKSLDLYKSNEDILQGQKKLVLDQNIELTKTLNETRSVSTWEKVGYFVLGVAVTGLAVHYGARLARP